MNTNRIISNATLLEPEWNKNSNGKSFVENEQELMSVNAIT
jgi:hypothetical protein